MSCFFGCKIKWNDELRLVKMLNKKYSAASGRVVDETEYVKKIQEGKCIKCGKIYQRKVNLQ